MNLTLERHDTVVVRTAAGRRYKLGNAIASGMSVTLNRVPLHFGDTSMKAGITGLLIVALVLGTGVIATK